MFNPRRNESGSTRGNHESDTRQHDGQANTNTNILIHLLGLAPAGYLAAPDSGR
jgi:hypothetical protein